MPRNMSFMLTTEQIRNQTKTVTRRLGWKFLEPGTILNACEKCMGLQKGEKINKLCQIRVVDVRSERLDDLHYNLADLEKEGFPDMEPEDFIEMFTREMKCPVNQEVTRIEFEYMAGDNKKNAADAKRDSRRKARSTEGIGVRGRDVAP